MFECHPFRLVPGQDLKKEISSFVIQNHIEAGWLGCCVGSLTQYNIRFANQSSGSSALGHFEIVSLTGTVSIHGCHLHISVSDEKGKTVGGHLLDGNIIYTTAEIVIIETDEVVFKRVEDPMTSWKELEIMKKQMENSRNNDHSQ